MKKCLFLTFIFLSTIMSAYAEEATKKFALSTTAFLDEGVLPVLYTCDGKDLSPQLTWTDFPDKTQTFALILSDADAPGGTFYHWVIYNIPKSVTTIEEGKIISTGTMGKNDWGKAQYNGPCPPKGGAHTYTFTLYALDSKLDLPAGADAKSVIKAMQNHILDKAQLTTTYSRWLK